MNKQTTIAERFDARAVMPPADRAELLADVERELATTSAALADATERLDEHRREAVLAEHLIATDTEHQRGLRAIARQLYQEMP